MRGSFSSTEVGETFSISITTGGMGEGEKGKVMSRIVSEVHALSL